MVSIYKVVGTFDQEIGWILNHLLTSGFKFFIVKVLLSTATYNIWFERNNRVFRGKRQSHLQVIQAIQAEVHAASVAWRNVKRTFANWELCLALGLSDYMFIVAK
uniref:Uncharacterized protein n=1 Tax=Davidia involucrata TaxID=16924 RepID=A0A5B7C0E9_DAVIN